MILHAIVEWGRETMRDWLAVGSTLLAVTLGCAAPQPVPVATVASPRRVAPPPAPPPPRKIKLAVMPADKLLLPKVAEAVNERLRTASVSGVGETTNAAISMEVAGMQLDCTQPTNLCFGQIAKHFGADRLLWAEIERARGKKKKAPTIVRIMLFDVARADVIGRAEQAFAGPVSNDALDQLLGLALTGSPAHEPRASQP
jgi:hypothetical protein